MAGVALSPMHGGDGIVFRIHRSAEYRRLQAKCETLMNLMDTVDHCSALWVELDDLQNEIIDDRDEAELEYDRAHGNAYTPTADEAKQIHELRLKRRALLRQEEELRIRHIDQFGDALAMLGMAPDSCDAERDSSMEACRLSDEANKCRIAIAKLQRTYH